MPSHRAQAVVPLRKTKESPSLAPFKALVQASSDMMALISRDYTYQLANHAYASAYSSSPEQMPGCRLVDVMGEQLFTNMVKPNLDRCFAGSPVCFTYQAPLGSAAAEHFHICYDPVRDEDGKVTAAAVVIRPIDPFHQEKMEDSVYQRLINDVGAIVWEVKLPELLFTFVSPSAQKILGYPLEDWYSKDFWVEHLHPDDREEAIRYCKEHTQLLADHEFEYRMIAADGREVWLHDIVHVVVEKGGEASHLRGVMTDITEKRQLSTELEFQATHDALTGLYNRQEFERRLKSLLATSGRKGNHALCYLDLDQFKVINDACGHLAGDDLLRQLGDLLNTRVRKADTLARLGGDEFGILMERCSLQQAQKIAGQFRDMIGEFRFDWEGKHFNLGVSIGLVPIGKDSGTMHDVLSAADVACYAAKDAGRNRVHLYHAKDEELSRRQGEIDWVAKTNQALEENRFQLYMQPIMPLTIAEEENPGHHYELLLRMIGEHGETIPPGAFLPAAERYNLSTKLDEWVINAAFDWFSTRPKDVEKLHLCAINLSALSLINEAFLSFILERLDSKVIPPEKLCFEVTETAAIANLSWANRFLNALKKRGCKIALDDFGSGLSSFSYLKNLPVDYLKIDGAFVRDIATDPIDRAMVASINEIGHVMGKKTIGEFVENKETLQALKDLDVDYAQGYAIGRPMPLTTIQPRTIP